MLCIPIVVSYNKNCMQIAHYFTDCDDFLYFLAIVTGSKF